MKKVKLRILRILTCLTLAMSMLLGTIMPTCAAGPETWGSNTGPWEYIRVTNDNWTPIKTMGRNGTLVIDNFVRPCKEGYCNCEDRELYYFSQVYVNIKIVNYDTGEVLANEWYREHSTFPYELSTNRPVYAGERLRVYFDICSLNNPPGPYRKAHIQFRYRFT